MGEYPRPVLLQCGQQQSALQLDRAAREYDVAVDDETTKPKRPRGTAHVLRPWIVAARVLVQGDPPPAARLVCEHRKRRAAKGRGQQALGEKRHRAILRALLFKRDSTGDATMRLLMLLATAMLGAQENSSTPESACRFSSSIAVGCIEGTEHPAIAAAELFKIYGFNRAKLEADYTKRYIRTLGCSGIDTATWTPIILLKGRVATTDGWVQVARLELQRPEQVRIVYAAAAYLDQSCPVTPQG